MFSAHNLQELRRSRVADLRLGDHLHSFRAFAHYVLRRCYQLRLRRWERREETHAFINDPALGGSLLMYYITPETQLRQLRQIGFSDIVMFDSEGGVIDTVDHDSSPWVHYVARKFPEEDPL